MIQHQIRFLISQFQFISINEGIANNISQEANITRAKDDAVIPINLDEEKLSEISDEDININVNDDDDKNDDIKTENIEYSEESPEAILSYAKAAKRKGNLCIDAVCDGSILCNCCKCVIVNEKEFCQDCDNENNRDQIKLIQYFYNYQKDDYDEEYEIKKSKFINLWSDSNNSQIEIDFNDINDS